MTFSRTFAGTGPACWSGAVRGVGTTLLVGALVLPAQTALGATQSLDDPQRLLASDAFGECVPEDSLDEIWLVLAKGGKSGQIPHVCMRGDCEDLPDIATWASAQQYPDDIDLNREEVQAQYADFVGDYCEPLPEDVPEVDLNVPEEEAPAVTEAPVPAEEPVPPVLLEAPVPAPLLARGAPGLFAPRTFTNTPAPFMTLPPSSLGFGGGSPTPRSTPEPTDPPTAGTPPGGDTPLFPPAGDDPLFPPPWEDPPDTTPPEDPTDPRDPSTPPSVVPLPAPLLLLLSGLGVLGLLRRRRA